MPALKQPRSGSLQFYPRKRASKILPSVNWRPIKTKGQGVLGFITYKVGMSSAIIKDNTEKAPSSGKQIVIPVTLLEAPNMKLYSLRFYKNKQVIKDIIVSNDKILKHKLRIPKNLKPLEQNIPSDYDDIHIIVYSLTPQTRIKKTPDIAEIAINAPNKLEFIKTLINKELSLPDLVNSELLDIRGLTTGKGFQGPVKRFGISLKQHKTEKGVRRPGSLGPWHPARVTFRTPMAGQLGFFTRIVYNLKTVASGKISEKDINPKSGFKNYGRIKTSYLIIKGSVPGPSKRQLLITPSFRPTKAQLKRKYQLIELIT